MHPVLNKNLFLVKEHVGIFKASNTFDIVDPESRQQVMQCREENLGFLTKMFRFTDYKRMTPFDITIKAVTGEKIVRVKRGVTFFVSEVEVLDDNDQPIGVFKHKFFSFGGKFEVYDNTGKFLCILKGKWTSWEFAFITADNKEFAKVTKKWAGLGKELFTSADNYILQISPDVPEDHSIRRLILAAVMCIDLVFKE